MTIFNVFSLFGGLALFLYGIEMMGDGLKSTAGDKLKVLLERVTSNRLVAVLVGTLVTAVIQASAAITVMAVGFVNAGLMTLQQAFGIMLGANIGTTITAWIISFNITQLAPLIIVMGVVPLLFFKNEKAKNAGYIITGFGLLFLGLSMMGTSMAPLKNEDWFVNLMVQFQNPLLGIIIGIIITTIIQSSSATVGILQTLVAQGLVSLHAGLYIVLGCNIGTCVTTLLAGVGANTNGRRTALLHLFNKTFGAVVFSFLIYFFPLTEIVAQLAPGLPMVQIAYFHTIFNILNTVLLLPMGNVLIKAVTGIISDRGNAEDGVLRLQYLDERILETPGFALSHLKLELLRMYDKAMQNYHLSMEAFFERDVKKAGKVRETEEIIDFINREVTPYLVKLQASQSILDEDKATLLHFHDINSLIERIGDHVENIADFAQERVDKDAEFSEAALLELQDMNRMVTEALEKGRAIFSGEIGGKELVRLTFHLEHAVSNQYDAMREHHISRLNREECHPRAGMIFTDMAIDLERISDHAMKIARYCL